VAQSTQALAPHDLTCGATPYSLRCDPLAVETLRLPLGMIVNEVKKTFEAEAATLREMATLQ